MGLQVIRASFRGQQAVTLNPAPTLNVLDQVIGTGAPSYVSFWSPGATLIDQADLQGVGQRWKLLSVAVQAFLAIQIQQQCYGKLGHIYTAVDTSGVLSQTSGGGGPPTIPYAPTLLQLPGDATLTAKLWDPDIDPLPPQLFTAAGNLISPQGGLGLNTVITLPIPLQMFGGIQILVGLWMQQMLVGTPQSGSISPILNVYLSNSSYALNFDDGE